MAKIGARFHMPPYWSGMLASGPTAYCKLPWETARVALGSKYRCISRIGSLDRFGVLLRVDSSNLYRFDSACDWTARSIPVCKDCVGRLRLLNTRFHIKMPLHHLRRLQLHHHLLRDQTNRHRLRSHLVYHAPPAQTQHPLDHPQHLSSLRTPPSCASP
jgi:hypothetical protein